MNTLEARRRILGRNVYKRTTEGNPAIAQGSLARMYPGIEMQGWTEQASTTGAQLFDISNIKTYIGGDIIEKSEAYAVDGNDIVVTNNIRYNIPGVNIPVDASQENIFVTYTTDSSEKYIFFSFIYTDGTKSTQDYYSANSHVIPLVADEGKTIQSINLGIGNDNGDISYTLSEIMVNYGSTALPYEPYTGGAPSPSPDYPQEIVSAGNWNEETQKWEYEIEVGGANLWDKEKASDLNNWVASVTQPGYSDFEIGVEPGQNITLSFPEKPPLGLGCYVGIVLEKDGKMMGLIYHSTNESLIHKAITTKSIGSKIWIRSHAQSISKFISQNPQFQIEYGDKRTEFMSYLKRSVTLTSDRPLTKWDRLEKRGGQWGWVYKSNIKSLPKTGFSIQKRINNNGVYYIKELPLSEYDTRIENIGNHTQYFSLFANKNPYANVGNYAWLYSIATNNVVQFRLGLQDDSIVSVQGLEEYLSELGEIIAVYETESETFVPLSTSEQEQMNELYTFRPTTVLSNDAGCEMSLTYKTKKSLEVTE